MFTQYFSHSVLFGCCWVWFYFCFWTNLLNTNYKVLSGHLIFTTRWKCLFYRWKKNSKEHRWDQASYSEVLSFQEDGVILWLEVQVLSQSAWVSAVFYHLRYCVALGKLLQLCVPPCPHSTCLLGLFWGVNE